MPKKTMRETIKESGEKKMKPKVKEEVVELSPEQIKENEWFSKRLAPQWVIKKIQEWINVPRRAWQILERWLYSLWIVWASPNANRKERRAYER